MLKSQILKSVGLIKKFINNIYFMEKNTFVAEVTFKG